eukprot:15485426-Alexandrium_andersonii.AAC.1
MPAHGSAPLVAVPPRACRRRRIGNFISSAQGLHAARVPCHRGRALGIHRCRSLPVGRSTAGPLATHRQERH